MLCSILYSRLWGCSCHKIDLLRRPYNKRVQSQPTVVQHHGCQCGRPPKGATRPRFSFLYTSPLSSTSKSCTSISSRSQFKPCALRIAAFRESVAAPQQGLRALLGMIGFQYVLTVRAVTRLFSRLLSGSDNIQQTRVTPEICASCQFSTQTSTISSHHLNLDSRWVGYLDTENGKTTSLGRYQGSSSSTT